MSLIFAAFYIAAVVLLLPGSLLTLSAGFLFGLGSGFIICSISSVLGATLAFLLGRFLARDWVAAKLLEMPRFAALDRAIGKRSAIIVLLTRLSPIFPFNLLNYALGLTGVSLRTYVLASWVGMMPGTLLYVYLGSIAKDLGSIQAQLNFEAARFKRAPVVIAVISRLKPDHKIPVWEQTLSAGAACQNLILTANLQGYAAQWLTEWYSYDEGVASAMALQPDERFAGFIYIGSSDEKPAERDRVSGTDVLTQWPEHAP